jgi:WD40 repeat protein
MRSLIDQFCPNIHDAPITAAAYDPWSGVQATADSNGVVAVQRNGESSPGLIFQPGAPIFGALALIRGGSLVAIGDEDGSVGVYSTADGSEYFREAREGGRGRVRAMRGVAISPDGSMLASISKDRLVRAWDLSRGERVNAWQDFSGETVGFDDRGERLLLIDLNGQPTLFDLLRVQRFPMTRLPMPASRAIFTLDGTLVLAAGPAGISLLRIADGAVVASFATQGGSGIMNLLISPDNQRCAVVTQRSVHQFSLPELQPVDSVKHGAPDPSGAAAWSHLGLRVGGADGLLHSGKGGSAGGVSLATGFGEHRLAVHHDRLAHWRGRARRVEINAGGPIADAQIDRDGRIIGVLPERGPIAVFDVDTGKKVFEAGAETSGATQLCVGGTVVAARMAQGGCRWWDLALNKGYELAWPSSIALSGGGTWLGVVTPKGAVRVLDPATGKDIMKPPTPGGSAAVRLLSFVNKRPDLLVFDAEGILSHYDLTEAGRGGPPAHPRDVLSVNVPVDRLWGIAGGERCALRLPEGATCTILFVDLRSSAVVAEHSGLHPAASVDPETGAVLQPARSAAVLELDMSGAEQAVLRALPGGEWISFGPRGVLAASPSAGTAI